MIVEFIGLPGTGKTTISRRVAKALEQKSIDVGTPMDDINSLPTLSRITKKFNGICLLFFCQPIAVIRILKMVSSSKQKKMSNLVHMFFNLSLVYWIIANNRKQNRIVILDQGGIQALWSIARRSEVKKCAFDRGILNSIKPDLLILLSSGYKSIQERLKKRDQTNRNVMKDIKRLAEEESYFENLRNYVAQTMDLENSTEQDLLRNTDTVMNQITMLINK